MGYYTGNGIVSSGGSTVSLMSTGPDVGGPYYVYNRTESTVTTKPGVSLTTAQAAHGDMNLDYYQWPGGAVTPACRGTRSTASYSQINDSNLYVLQTTAEVVQVRCKQGTYDSGWIS
jgi:hypothetical protein